MSSNHEDGRPQGLPLALDPIAKSASTTELAFIAKPAGTPLYHGFLLSMYGRGNFMRISAASRLAQAGTRKFLWGKGEVQVEL